MRPAGYLGLAPKHSPSCQPGQLTALLKPGKRVFLVEFTSWDEPDNRTLTRLLGRYGRSHEHTFRGVRVVEVDLDGAIAPDPNPDCTFITPA